MKIFARFTLERKYTSNQYMVKIRCTCLDFDHISKVYIYTGEIHSILLLTTSWVRPSDITEWRHKLIIQTTKLNEQTFAIPRSTGNRSIFLPNQIIATF